MARTTLGGMGLGFQRRNLPSPGGIRTIQRTVLVSCHIRDSEFRHRHLHGSTVVAVAAKLSWRVALKSRDTAFATGNGWSSSMRRAGNATSRLLFRMGAPNSVFAPRALAARDEG